MFSILTHTIKYKAWFLVPEGKVYTLKKKKRFNPLKPIIRYKKHPYNPIIEEPTFRKGLFRHYFFNVINGKQLNGKQLEKQLQEKEQDIGQQIEIIEGNNDKDAEPKDLIMAKQIIVQVFKSLEPPKFSINWLHLVIIGLGCILGGWILGTYIPIGLSGG